MAQLEVTLEQIQHRSERKHNFTPPISTTIGIGESYTITPNGTGSVLLDTLSNTEYTVSENVSVLSALIAAVTDVNITNTANDGASLDVSLQDQHTPAVITTFHNTTNQTTLSVAAVKYDNEITLTDPTGVVVGSYIVIFDPASVRFTPFHVVAVNASVITVDQPIDFAYPIGTFVDIGSQEMAVNGSVTPQVFGIRGTGAPQGVALTFDVTRVILTCITASAIDLSSFGDLTKLTNGLMLRKRDGATYNIANVKNNRELLGIAFDFDAHEAGNGSQGEDGFTCRLTFGGQNKIGVVQRLELGEDLEWVVQDDLSGLTSLEIVVEGHIVEEPA